MCHMLFQVLEIYQWTKWAIRNRRVDAEISTPDHLAQTFSSLASHTFCIRIFWGFSTNAPATPWTRMYPVFGSPRLCSYYSLGLKHSSPHFNPPSLLHNCSKLVPPPKHIKCNHPKRAASNPPALNDRLAAWYWGEATVETTEAEPTFSDYQQNCHVNPYPPRL